jgi:hypothetical protein
MTHELYEGGDTQPDFLTTRRDNWHRDGPHRTSVNVSFGRSVASGAACAPILVRNPNGSPPI